MIQEKLITILYGPTASGKTARAYLLARQIGADILSFDSRHVYKGMDIVTGKDLPPDDAHFEIFGVDLITPDQDFSIRHYYEYAKPILEKSRQQQKPLILVGGSWQYADVLLHPPASLLAQRDESLRKLLESQSTQQLQQQVQEKNPERWSSMNASDRSNPRRLIRAIETSVQSSNAVPALIKPEEYKLVPLNPEMAVLEERILARIEQRLTEGALEETQQMITKYPDWSLPAFSSTGYRFLRQYLENGLSLDEAKHLWYLQERQYVKRQKTWLKKLTPLS